MLIKALNSRRKVLVVRKFATTLKDSVFQLVIDTLKKWQIYKYCRVNLSSYTIVLPNESVFLFKGMDDSEKIKSITDITDIWCEEATELRESEYAQLDLRLRALAPNLQLICSYNPVSKQNWVYNRWHSIDSKYDEANTMILQTTYKDNAFLPPEYIQTLESQMEHNYSYYKIYALGEFATLEKLVFTNWKIEDFDYHEIKGETAIGMDFGFSNDLSTIVQSIITPDTIYICRTWGDTGKTNDDLVGIINAFGFGKSKIIADAAEPKSIEEIRRKGISRIVACSKGRDSIIHGIQKLQQYKIIVHPSCVGIITDFENYSWKKDRKTEEYINEPIDSFNHYIDALRYSIQVVDKDNKLKTISKDKLRL
ncbi:MAG: PBSX family phage terminase large subunit [Prevotellaceae bacterium]|nr:PBSX family phage terminase large subunit [Candidatus Faecinaster equi]